MENFTWNVRGQLLLFTRPLVMGILNHTPDSFFDGGRYADESQWMAQAEKMVSEGADILDVGGMSTRPNAAPVSTEEEIKRVVPVVSQLRRRFPELLISVDTYRSEVAEAALEAGASLLNDVSGGTEDERIFAVAVRYRCPLMLMHHQGTMSDMHQQTEYRDFMADVIGFLAQQTEKARLAGVHDVVVDPGFGFSKTLTQNYQLLQQLDALQIIGKPVLAGMSRKSMLYKFLDITPQDALNATSVVNTFALQKGAAILRVHDVREAVECVRIVEQLKQV